MHPFTCSLVRVFFAAVFRCCWCVRVCVLDGVNSIKRLAARALFPAHDNVFRPMMNMRNICYLTQPVYYLWTETREA